MGQDAGLAAVTEPTTHPAPGSAPARPAGPLDLGALARRSSMNAGPFPARAAVSIAPSGPSPAASSKTSTSRYADSAWRKSARADAASARNHTRGAKNPPTAPKIVNQTGTIMLSPPPTIVAATHSAGPRQAPPTAASAQPPANTSSGRAAIARSLSVR